MELVPLASAALGVLGGIIRLLNTGVAGGGGKKGGKGGADDVKLTLTPPLFERHRDRNAFVRSPLEAYDLHRLALFNHFFADRHVLIATAQLQPVQNSNYHDVEALIRVPAVAWPSLDSSIGAAAAALPSSSFLSSHAASSPSQTPSDPVAPPSPPPYPFSLSSASPVADAVIRVQPSPAEPTFLQVALSTANGGVANAIGCYSLAYKGTGEASKPGLNPRAAVFFQAPLFSSERHDAREEPFTPPGGAAVGLRVDHLGTSAGVSVSPLQPSQVSGWLSSSTTLSSSQGTGLRGGCSFRADTSALSSVRGAEGVSQAVQVDGKLSYIQMVEADVDSAAPTHAPVPAYEVGVTLKNGGEELVTSVFNHLVLRRRVYNWWEDKRVVGITQYVDLGMELAMKKTAPPSWRVAASWQLNKGLLLKTRLSDVSASAAVALKSWQSPNTTFSAALHYHYAGRVQVGLTFALENVGAVLFGRTQPQYKRTINTRRKDVTYEWQEEQRQEP